MDYQIFINIAFGLCSFLAAWVLNRIFTLLDRLDRDVRALPVMYVTKEDYRGDLSEIKRILVRIDERLENKADK